MTDDREPQLEQTSNETELSPEITEFQAATQHGEAHFLDIIQQRFEADTGANSDMFAYHRVSHSREVMGRVERILKAVEADSDKIALGRLVASAHDTIQSGHVDIQGKLVRYKGPNEHASAEELDQWMQDFNTQNNHEIFTPEDRSVAREAIIGTVPSYDPDKTIIQPNIQPGAQEITLALALADLGAFGMQGPETLLAEGDANFREEHFAISKRLRDPEVRKQLTETEKAEIMKLLIGWSKFQVIIAHGFKRTFEEDRLPLLDSVSKQENLRQIFSYFEEPTFTEAIGVLEAKIAERESLSFEDLVAEMYPDLTAEIQKDKAQSKRDAIVNIKHS